MASASSRPRRLPFHGEGTCAKCERKAYFSVGGGRGGGNEEALCGRHAPQPLRRPLPKNPDRDRIRAEAWREHDARLEWVRLSNEREGRRGAVACCGMTMFQGQQPVFVPGFLNVFPNFRHGGRYGGLGLPALSPKAMGPVEHGQPGLPPARNLENFHQFSKRFRGETEEEFRRAQAAGFGDPEPHRHKPASKGKNACEAWVWVRPSDGSTVELSYVECRQFYCNLYERFALASPDYRRLCELRDRGTNLRVCGFDGYAPDRPLEEHYLDPSRPFGHELVLFTMLSCPHESSWPWRKHKTEAF